MPKIEAYSEKYINEAIAIWNDIVEDGIAFPQKETLDAQTGDAFFKSQSFTGIAIDADSGEVVGLYILHPNNVGRCGHISNEIGFRILQFNAVVATNTSALKLYKKLGFTQLGVIPKGFLLKDGNYEDIIPHYIEL